MVGSRLRFPLLMRTLRQARRAGLWAELMPLLRSRLFPVRRSPEKVKNPSPPALFQMAAGYWVSQAVYVAAKLGIADLLAEGPKSISYLAAATGADAASLFRLMRALASLDVFSHSGSGYFALSDLGEGLRSDVPGSLRATVITLGEIHYQACGSLLHSVQTGSSGFRHVFGTDLFEYLEKEPSAADAFNQGMTDLSAMLSYAVLCAYDFSGIRHVMDIGGGQGAFLRNVLQFHPELKATVFDTASTIEKGKPLSGSITGGARLSFVSGDFFASVPPGADAHLLCGVIHDWDDDRAVRILRNCRQAMGTNGRVVLIETIVPDDNATCFSKLLDLNMLVMTGGRERTRREFEILLNAAGYRLTRVVPTLAPQSVIEGVPG